MNVIAIAIICISFAFAFGLLFFLDMRNNAKQMSLYIDVMAGTDDIMKSLTDAQGLYNKRSVAYMAIYEAEYYLQNSIMRDYETAFSIIEKCFRQEDVKKLHETLIENEKNKIIYLLSC